MCYGICTNTVGSYKCLCLAGTHGDPFVPGGCVVSGAAGRCNHSCGDGDVPFPFGIGPVGCYWPGFNLTCDHSSNPPRLFLDSDHDLLRVQEISLRHNTVRVLVDGASRLMPSMYRSYGSNFDRVYTGLGDTPYSLSTNSNELILVGCNVQAFLFGDSNGNATITGCTSFCPVNRLTGSTHASRRVPPGGSDRYCYGIGCCQARISISKNNMPSSWMITMIDENQERQGKNSSPAAMLIAEEGWFHQRQVSDKLARDFQLAPP